MIFNISTAQRSLCYLSFLIFLSLNTIFLSFTPLKLFPKAFPESFLSWEGRKTLYYLLPRQKKKEEKKRQELNEAGAITKVLMRPLILTSRCNCMKPDIDTRVIYTFPPPIVTQSTSIN